MLSITFSINVFTLLVILGLILYKLLTKNFDYWKKRNVPYVKPIPFFGNYFQIMTFRSHTGMFLANLYNQFNTPYFGIFVLNRPHLVIKSPELIKSIFAKDFDHFHNRTFLSYEKWDPLFSNLLFTMHNPPWKTLRAKITPVFTTGKIKGMLELVNNCAQDMNDYIQRNMNKDSIEAKELCAKFSTDMVASCAAGINAYSFDNEDAEFRVIARKMFDFEWETALRQTLYVFAPTIARIFKIEFFKPYIYKFFKDVSSKTIKLREETNAKRNDAIDIIIQMRKQTECKDADFTGDRVVAMVFQFFVAGLETISSSMAFTLYELCLAPEIQTKLRTEIKEMVSKYGKLTYEAIQDMNYLHMVICESLRKYPVLPFLDRMCIKDYKLPNSDLVIEKGTPVYIPMFGLHYDPKYYPEPEKFDPERFSEENKKSLIPFTYLPFGEGPRNCIGERFGLLVTKLGVARILSEYELVKSSDTPVPLRFGTKNTFLSSNVDLPIKFKKPILDAA